MFKNPLKKYAAGGVTNAQKQELVQVFSKAASKLQIEPEVLIQKAQELTGEEQAGFMQAIQDVADNNQPKPESLQFIQNVFRKSGQSSQAFKDGGKIHDFICKHAIGGRAADCGCKQEGGNVEVPENKRGYTASTDRFKKDGSVAALDEKANGVTRTTLFPGTSNEWSYFTDYTGYPSVTYEPRNQIEWGRGLGDFITYVPDQKWRWMNTQMDVARKYGTPDYKENGGQIQSAQLGTLLGRLYNRFIGRRAPNTAEANNRRIREWVDRNGTQHIIEDANVNGNSTITSIDINGADTTGRQKVTTGDGRYRMINLQPGTPEWRAVMGRNLVGKDPNIKLELYSDGGEIKKKDNTKESSNGTITQGKPRSKVAQAIDNNPKARHFVEGAKKFVKSPMVKWPLAGAAAYGGWKVANLPFVQETGEIAPLISKGLFPFLTQLRPKFILDTMNPLKESPKAEKSSDVFWVAKEQEGGLMDFYKNKWKNDFFD